MGRIGENSGVLYLGVAAGVYLKPEYAICNSRIATMVILLIIVTVSKLIYQLFLYPALFTPAKHIQTPPVSQPGSFEGVFHSSELRFLESALAHWEYYIVFPRNSI